MIRRKFLKAMTVAMSIAMVNMTGVSMPVYAAEFETAGSVIEEIVGAEEETLSYAVEGGNIYYNPTSGTIVRADKTVTAAIIPSEIDGVEIVAIGVEAFRDCSALKSVEIHGSVKLIDSYAFYNCSNLSDLELLEGVEIIGIETFYGCGSLSEIILPNSITTAGENCFGNCIGVKKIFIPQGPMESSTFSLVNNFSGCSDIEVVVEEGVKNIRTGVFSGCTFVSSVKLPSTLEIIESTAFGYCENIKDITIPSNVTKIEGSAFKDCTGLTSIHIPSNVKEVGANAFDGCTNAKTLILEEGVQIISSNAFSNCGFYEVIIPESIESVGDCAFYTRNAAKVTVSDEVLKRCEIDVDWLFSNYELVVNLKEGSTIVPASAFYDSYCIKEIIIPEGVKTIEDKAFEKCYNLEKVTLSSSVESIGEYAFYYCDSLDGLVLPKELKTIGTNAFAECKTLSSITIPESVTHIGYRAFYDCGNLKELIIEDGVTGIQNNAFESCFGLEEVTIPGSVKSISEECFFGCNDLEYIILEDGITEIKERAFLINSKDATVVIPKSVKKLYGASINRINEIYYHGTEAEWEQIEKEPYATNSEATIHFIGDTGVTNLKAATYGNEKVKLTWTKQADADGYIIYRKKASESAFSYRWMVSGATTSYIDTTASNSEYNFYRIYPYVMVNEKRILGPSTTYVYAKGGLTAVTDLKATGVTGGVKLTWSKVTDAEGYIVYGKRGSDATSFSYVGMTSNLAYTDTKALTTDYNFYRVYPYYMDDEGNRVLGPSTTYVYAKAK